MILKREKFLGCFGCSTLKYTRICNSRPEKRRLTLSHSKYVMDLRNLNFSSLTGRKNGLCTEKVVIRNLPIRKGSKKVQKLLAEIATQRSLVPRLARYSRLRRSRVTRARLLFTRGFSSKRETARSPLLLLLETLACR